MKQKLLEIIDQLTSIGLNVHAIIISGTGSNFQWLINELGISPNKPWFMYKGKKSLACLTLHISTKPYETIS